MSAPTDPNWRDNAREYASGECDVFAAALSREFGYQPVALRAYFLDKQGRRVWSTPHLFALRNDGTPIDSLGPTSMDEIVNRGYYVDSQAEGSELQLVPITEQDAMNELKTVKDRWVEEARVFIRKYRDFYA